MGFYKSKGALVDDVVTAAKQRWQITVFYRMTAEKVLMKSDSRQGDEAYWDFCVV